MMWLFIFIILVQLGYIYYVHRQLRAINVQLGQRMRQKSDQPIRLQLMNRELNQLVKKINQVLQQEMKMRQLSKQEQLYYKEMISNISHDFRTPLTSIKGYQQLIAKGPLNDEQRHKLSIANAHVQNLEHLLETFFEYSYLLSHHNEPQTGHVPLNLIIEEYVAAFYTQFEAKGIGVKLIGSSSIIAMQSDEGMIRRILQNLIQNALQHSEDDVEIRYWQEIEFTYITFKNRIQPQENFSPEQLFDRFYTIDRTRKRNSGLGLSIVRLLSEKLGGSAHAVMENGHLRFIIKLATNPDNRSK
ncbi:hypothetical protein PSTEL_22275 [Paenibacillus stellifer]|uniref:histidine kinase n=1 Tax=Paenibacillus stellifer TaxID=169760 RepID=A0A089LX28_9BACL|nr:HAMP domain-containing sensor histidine kinase [Paenibacillus stellifer]AIQ65432.1 hypothetical protein PSTEL_22275 [Paenibacillus stellifer]